jgi:hypothetical protein
MNKIHINYLLKNNKVTKKNFKGTFAADELSKITGNGHYIINLDMIKDKGSHWILLIIKNKDVLYFCPSGTAPFELHIVKKIKSYDKIYYSPKRIQHILSQSCGLFCIVISYLISKGRTLRESIDIFTEDDDFLNEVIVYNKIRKYFHHELL